MSGPTLTVHRATDQIGGNCIEIAGDGHRLILDVGRPLDAPSDAQGLIPATLDLAAPDTSVLISHPHQDHYGLLEETPASWPVYSGAATERLIRLTAGIFRKRVDRQFRHWIVGQATQIGPFTVKPWLTDHSAFDAHMLQIDGMGRRILYSGDFRRHGRKSGLVERLMADPPANVDVLLMEGTNLGTTKPSKTEAALESEFIDLFNSTPGRVFVAWSAQNVDRTVTLYRAALQAGRTLVVDLYTAEVMQALGDFGRLPLPDWSRIMVVVTSSLARMYRRRGDEAFVQQMVENGISARKLEQHRTKWVVMVRPSLARDYARSGVTPTSDDAWSFSQWSGYLKAPDGQALQQWFDQGGAQAKHIHTSGHASPDDLRAFANAIAPKWLVPIHGIAWDEEQVGFPPVKRLRDGEPLLLA
ncbi:MBL fold metallo-hydrolase [Phenylobacterium sp.]|uniref:MBL fold metallo-hydrolase n=1 Tax=Phenylobacterium sp. TaxID=1871053 RepID=UPI002F93373B